MQQVTGVSRTTSTTPGLLKTAYFLRAMFKIKTVNFIQLDKLATLIIVLPHGNSKNCYIGRFNQYHFYAAKTFKPLEEIKKTCSTGGNAVKTSASYSIVSIAFSIF